MQRNAKQEKDVLFIALAHPHLSRQEEQVVRCLRFPHCFSFTRHHPLPTTGSQLQPFDFANVPALSRTWSRWGYSQNRSDIPA